jgi:hypothetical protein
LGKDLKQVYFLFSVQAVSNRFGIAQEQLLLTTFIPLSKLVIAELGRGRQHRGDGCHGNGAGEGAVMMISEGAQAGAWADC